MKRIILLGSTGSIGDSTCAVVRSAPHALRLVALAAGKRWEKLEQQALEFGVTRVAVADEAGAEELQRRHPDWQVGCGAEALTALATMPDADYVVGAMVGAQGARPVLAALAAGRDVGLANKETLVMAGEVVMRTARASGAQVVPIDSEHSALFQCLQGERAAEVTRLILTASGGPFLNRTADLDGITPAEALAHPKWSMGAKVTIDSSTLMNKGLEVIEAHHLFGFVPAQVSVVVHPQSIVHLLVEFVDGASRRSSG
ncbi:MAG TPA: 1-deoxy-D-xylulose-5-phosphate reductoisomerase [bacterium]|nr:1-deoxy-D-xylulose-5-phosphate reductoisomerase [bacterium]